MKKLLLIALLLPMLASAGNEQNYKTGWDDAHARCMREYQQMEKILEQSGFQYV